MKTNKNKKKKKKNEKNERVVGVYVVGRLDVSWLARLTLKGSSWIQWN